MKPTEPYVDEKGVLHDSAALAVIEAVERHNCLAELRGLHRERVEHFARRIGAIGRHPDDVMIVVLNVDDPHGAVLADILMPGHNWQSYRDNGQVPYARGLAGRAGIQGALDEEDPDRGKQLREISGAAVMMVARGVVLVTSVAEVLR